MDPAQAIEVAAMSRLKAMNDVIGLGDSEIQRFYNNSVVFLTGGSGFLGKQLIEKVFRSCNISKMYLLLRSKKGMNTQQRLDRMIHEPVFDVLRKQKPDFFEKMIIIEGDVAEIKLGIKDDDWKSLTEEVDVIFHVAATTRFDETLKKATLINVRGTREILQLGKACKKLKTYVHVSTAYSHATQKLIGSVVDEEFYKTAVPPATLIAMAETMEEQRLNIMTPALIKDWPNTYAFTKSIAEEQVRTMSTGLPICIVRPGIVICSYNEPSPGWLDISCINGATGFLFGTGLGLLHTIQVNTDAALGFIPCDFVNNAIIAAGRETAANQTKGGNDTRIYAVTTTRRNPNKWKNFAYIMDTYSRNIPSPESIAYIYGYDTNYKFVFMILSLFLHLIPAYFADFICLLIGKERRFAKTAKKAYNMCNTMSYFLINEWDFADDNLEKLYKSLSNRDKAIFNFDITDINWVDFILIWCVGGRKYIVKDGLKGTAYAVKKQKVLRIVHYIFMSLYLYTIWKFIYFIYYIVSNVLLSVINLF